MRNVPHTLRGISVGEKSGLLLAGMVGSVQYFPLGWSVVREEASEGREFQMRD